MWLQQLPWFRGFSSTDAVSVPPMSQSWPLQRSGPWQRCWRAGLLTHCVRTFQHETGRLDRSLPRFGQLYREGLSPRPDHLQVKEAFLMVPETSPCSPESSQQQGWVRSMSLTQICSLSSPLPCHGPWTSRICRRCQADL